MRKNGRTVVAHVFYEPMMLGGRQRMVTRMVIWMALIAPIVSQAASLHAQSKRALSELGRFEPPPYAPPLVRQGDPWPVFDEAMQAYARKQYQHCADLLRRAVTGEPDDAAANVFLAAALMMTDEVGEAEDRAGVALAAGMTPHERMARFVLAKASIRLGKLDVAERELTILAGGADRFALDAAGLLPRVRALKKR